MRQTFGLVSQAPSQIDVNPNIYALLARPNQKLVFWANARLDDDDLWGKLDHLGGHTMGCRTGDVGHANHVKDVEQICLGLFGYNQSLDSKLGQSIGGRKTRNSQPKN